MPTQHRRINVTCDPELAAALDGARAHLDETSDAARLRALALAGATALAARTPEEREGDAALARLLAIPGVRPAKNRDRHPPYWDEMMKEPITTDGTDALEWVRGER